MKKYSKFFRALSAAIVLSVILSNFLPSLAFAEEITTEEQTQAQDFNSTPDLTPELTSDSIPLEQISDPTPTTILDNPVDPTIDPPLFDPGNIDLGNLENPITDTKPDQTLDSKIDPEDIEKNPVDAEPKSLSADKVLDQTRAQNNNLSLKTFKPDVITGALGYQIPIEIPQGRNGQTPEISLSYNSANRSPENLVGLGWSLNLPVIERVNRYGSENLYSGSTTTPQVFYSSLSGELKNSSGNSYVPKVDDGSLLSYTISGTAGNESWIVTDKLGNTYTFGVDINSRLTNGVDRIFRWYLVKVQSADGNYINYSYAKDGNQVYPYQIIYSNFGSLNGIFKVEFVKEVRSDTNTSRNYGFPVTTNFRISEVRVYTSNVLNRKYAITYQPANNGISSLLSSVLETGYDESGLPVSLLPQSFSYTSPTKTWSRVSTRSPVPFVDGNDTGVRTFEANGDGLPDLIQAYTLGGNPIQRVFINKGNNQGWVEDPNYVIPYSFWTFTDGVTDYGRRIIDVNGDGYDDLVRSIATENSVYVNNKNGTGWTLDPNYSTPVTFSYNNRQDSGVRFGDVNGDGLVDLIQGKANDGGSFEAFKVFINKGDGTGWSYKSSYIVPAAFTDGIKDYGTRLMDVNGDGYVDLVQGKASSGDFESHKVFINKGDSTGWEYDSHYTVPFTFTDGNTDLGIRGGDLNGDGLDDVMKASMESSGAFTSKAYINNGNGTGWTEDVGYTAPTPFVSESGNDTGERLFDMDGDGLSDFVRAQGAWTTFTTDLRNGECSDLLQRVDLPSGGNMQVTYKSTPEFVDQSGSLLNPKLPVRQLAVSKTITDDGFGNLSTKNYEYSGGSYYYQNEHDKKLAGFAKLSATDQEILRRTNTYYHQGNESDWQNYEFSDDWSKIGKPYRTEILNGSNDLLAMTLTGFDRHDSASRTFVYPGTSENYSYSGANYKVSAAQNTYDDAFGNLIQTKEFGGVLVPTISNSTMTNLSQNIVDTGTDARTKLYTYTTGSTGLIKGLLASSELQNYNAGRVSYVKNYYDSQILGVATVGKLTSTKTWDDQTNLDLTTTYTYNTYGLLKDITNPRNYKTSFGYDSTYLYPTSKVNPLLQTTTYSYDLETGQVASSVDPNNFKIQNTFDGFGRLTKVQASNQALTALVTRKLLAYQDSAFPRSVHLSEYQTENISPRETYVYVDGLGREVQTKVINDDPTPTWNSVTTKYDSGGRVQKVYVPFVSTTPSYESTTQADIQANVSTYDELDRPLIATNALGNTNYVYDNWITKITDPKGNQKNYTSDGYGRLANVDENTNGSTFTTNYSYNSQDKLTKIVDAENRVRNFGYDSRGELLSSELSHAVSAPAKIYQYRYDSNGNNIRITYPDTHYVLVTFDELDRQKTIDDPTTVGSTEITYTYDSALNGKGKIANIKTPKNSVAYNYDKQGSVSFESHVFDLGIASSTQNVTYLHDNNSALTGINYSNGVNTSFIYGRTGKIKTVNKGVALIANLKYGPTEAPESITYSNGVVTKNTYDPNKLYLLTNKKTYTVADINNIEVPLTTFSDTNYVYDANKNISSVTDVGSVMPKSVTYIYDGLDRLGTTTVAVATSTQTLTYTYSPSGNILKKSDVGNYAYGDLSHTDAVTTAGSYALTYDANGNLITETRPDASTYNYQYDFLNRLKHTNKNQVSLSDYVYLSGTKRIQKLITGGAKTNYVGDYFESSTPVGFKSYIFAGNDRLVTVDNAGVNHFNSTDNLNSASIVTDSAKNIEQNIDYYPYGTERINNQTGSFASKFTYTDQEKDGESGLIYYDARYYHPTLGRFTSVDPASLSNPEQFLKDPQQLNLYSYAKNNPVKYSDPTGLTPSDTIGQMLQHSIEIPVVMVTGMVNSIFHPINTMQTISQAIKDVPQNLQNLPENLSSLGQSYSQASDSNRGRMLAGVAGFVFSMITPEGELGNLGRIPDEALVVRGGGLANQTVAKIDASIAKSTERGVNGFSVQCSANCTSIDQLGTLGEQLRNNQVAVTNAGTIRKAGGDVVNTGYGSHATVFGLTGEQASPLLQNIFKNPNPKL